eukprot:jgi/Picsp_1/2489/NSC_00720-R1_fatty acid 2-hydroxylase
MRSQEVADRCAQQSETPRCPNSEKKTTLIISGNFYEIDESFQHPGGNEILRRYNGKDVTSLFLGEHSNGHKHGKAARQLLDTFLLGPAAEGKETPTRGTGTRHTEDSRVDLHKPIFSQVIGLDEDYIDWIHRPVNGKPRFFFSSWAEAVTKVKWWIVPMVWIPVSIASFTVATRVADVQYAFVLALLGGGLWQLIEYSLHRCLFHWVPRKGVGIFLHFLFHGCHHKFPMDTDRLVFPPIPASWVAMVIFASLRLCFSFHDALAVFSGILLGYVAYDCIHYFIHSGRMKTFLSRHHMIHHFVDHNSNYGISSPLLDILLWTIHPQSNKES